MANTITLKLDGGWKKFETLLTPARFTSRLKTEVRRANVLNGRLAVAKIRRHIKDGAFERNAPLTTALKRSSKPLVDHGDLWQAIAADPVDWSSVFVGVKQRSGLYDVARALHEGSSLRVTKRMRDMFFMLWLASQGRIDGSTLTGRARVLWDRMPGYWEPLKDSTAVIRIPSRPFITRAFEDGALREAVLYNWEQAVQRALTKG